MAEPHRDDLAAARATSEAVATGIWSPFRSLLTAQVLSAVLGLVFWVIVARMVDAHDVGIAAAAISLQTLLGIVTVLGCSTMLVSELPKAAPGPTAHHGAALAAGRVRVVGPRGGRGGGVLAAAAQQPGAGARQPDRRRDVRAGHGRLRLGAGGRRRLPRRQAIGAAGLAQPGRLQLPVPGHRCPAPPGVHRRARAPGLLGAAAARLHPLHAVAAPAAAARPHQPAAAGGRAWLHRSRPAQPCAEPVAGCRVADGPGRRGAHARLGGERGVRDRVVAGDVRLPAAVPAVDRAVRARCEHQRGGVPTQYGADDSRGALPQRAALRGRVGARRAGAAHLRWRLLPSLLGDPGVVGASRALDGDQGPPGRPVADAAAVRARDTTGRRGADLGDRWGHDRWDHRRCPWSLHRVVDRNGSGNGAGPSVAAPGLRWPALALAAAHA